MSQVIYLIICGAGPAPYAARFLAEADAAGMECHVISTPAGTRFIDQTELEQASRNPVISEHRQPGEPRRGRPNADAVVIAPATANTICKLSAGITDTYALDIAAECIGLGVPTVVVPFVNSALASRAPYRRAVASLLEEGVIVYDIANHEPHQGAAHLDSFPWTGALSAAIERAA